VTAAGVVVAIATMVVVSSSNGLIPDILE